MNKHKILSIILLLTVIVLSPVVMIFVSDHLVSQNVNIRNAYKWISVNHNKLAQIYCNNRIFMVDMYTGNNGCVRIAFSVDKEHSKSVLDEIMKLKGDVAFFVEYPDFKHDYIK